MGGHLDGRPVRAPARPGPSVLLIVAFALCNPYKARRLVSQIFRDLYFQFWVSVLADFVRKANLDGTSNGPIWSRPEARAVWDRFLVRPLWFTAPEAGTQHAKIEILQDYYMAPLIYVGLQ